MTTLAGLTLLAAPSSPAAAAAPEIVPGELIVSFKRKAGSTPRTRALASAAARRASDLPLPRTKLVRVGGGRAAVSEAIAQLEADPAIAYAEPNYIRRQRTVPNDPSYRALWGASAIGAPRAWDVTTGSSEVTIAVTDDGIDFDHPDLAANVWQNPGETGGDRPTNGIDDDRNGYVDDWRGWDFASHDNSASPGIEWGEPAYHGTHVSGILGAVGNNRIGVAGINWTVSIMPLRIFGNDDWTTTARIVKAFRYAGRNGAEVINASWGGGGRSRAELNAIKYRKRSLVVAAAPDEGIDIDVKGDYPCDYPVSNLLCVTVSNRLGLLPRWAGFGARNVDLAAPGIGILSTTPGATYEYLDGTSMATPVVAGAAGLVAAANPSLTARQIKSILLTTAEPLSGLIGKVLAGQLDVGAAVALATG